VRMLMAATGMGRTGCERALAEAGGDTRVALVSLLGQVPPQVAAAVLRDSDGSVREALRLLLPADLPDMADVGIDAAVDAVDAAE
jgi:N-acetylmuramic acid 6-phosphate etherase